MLKWVMGWFVCFLLGSSCYGESLKVGVTAGPHGIIMEKVKERANAVGIDIQVIEFNDFNLPNAALDAGEIDINSYQHEPFLNEQVKNRGYNIRSAGKTVLMPMGIYSQKVKRLKDIKDNATIAIPNDPTNEGRALKLLEKEGFIKLSTHDNPSLLDIVDNPRNFKIIELEAPHLPRSLEDVDLAVINTDWVILSKLDPKSALALEDLSSPYTNVFAVRMDEHRSEVTQFIKIYQSEEIKTFINEKFKGAILPAW